MAEGYNGTDRREFLRHDFRKPLKFTTVNVIKDREIAAWLADATAKNVSTSGMPFITNTTRVSEIASLLALSRSILPSLTLF